MELSASLTPFLYITGAFVDSEIFFPAKNQNEQVDSAGQESDTERSAWRELLSLNTNADSSGPTWQVDGCTSRGVQYLAQPFLSGTLHPRKIDIFIPDQAAQPKKLRRLLRTSSAFHHSSQKSRELPICRYLASLLRHWSAGIEDFDQSYRSLPYGSRIVVENLSIALDEVRIHVIPARKLVRRFLGREELSDLWSLSMSELPDCVPLEELELKTQIHSNVSLVAASNRSTGRLWALKTNVKNPNQFYHELRTLIKLPPHPNIISRPEYLIEGPGDTPHLPKVYGFLTEYYPLGNLGHVMREKRETNGLTLDLQLHWSTQLVSALQWIQKSTARYYSGIKLDNIICVTERWIKIIDLEQSGNWATFTAPEIHYVNQIQWLYESRYLPEEKREKYRRRLLIHLPDRQEVSPIYSNPPQGYFDTWNTLSPEGQDSAMVYALGKTIWCIFEGWSHLKNFCDEDWDEPCGWEFPECRSTPLRIQELIRDCTQGSPMWDRDHLAGLVRVGDEVYPRGLTGIHGERAASATETVLFAKDYWMQEVKRMEDYLDVKERWHSKCTSDSDLVVLGFTKRPSMNQVAERLHQERSSLDRN